MRITHIYSVLHVRKSFTYSQGRLKKIVWKLSVFVSVYLLSFVQSSCLCIVGSLYVSTFSFLCLSACLSVYLSISLYLSSFVCCLCHPARLYSCISVCLSVCVSIFLCTFLFFYVTCFSVVRSTYKSKLYSKIKVFQRKLTSPGSLNSTLTTLLSLAQGTCLEISREKKKIK